MNEVNSEEYSHDLKLIKETKYELTIVRKDVVFIAYTVCRSQILNFLFYKHSFCFVHF